MTANQFERELIKAIEHGCPKCGNHDFDLFTWEEYRYHVEAYGNDQLYYEADGLVEGQSQDKEVMCPECYLELWSEQDGWIPELADIVKGE